MPLFLTGVPFTSERAQLSVKNILGVGGVVAGFVSGCNLGFL